MAGVVYDTKIHPSEKHDMGRFRSYQGGAGPSSLTERKNQQDRIYEIQTDLTLEEARYSEMRKKIPFLGRIPKDRIDTENEKSDFHKRKLAHLTFVRENFREIECCKFVPDPEKIKAEDNLKIWQLKCHCGEIYTEHADISKAKTFTERRFVEEFLVPEELRSYINYEKLLNAPPENLASILSSVTWNKEAFRKSRCSTFGKICFVNYENSKPAKYIRLSHDDSVDRCMELMVKHWKILEPKRPSLCISVIGGAKSFKMDNRTRDTLHTGLIKAGKSTNALLITTGSNVGVMKAVGNAVSEGQSYLLDDHRITHALRLIGIGPWGYVQNRKNLKSDGNGCFPVHFQTSNTILRDKPVPLNPNHTHFVFVDDGFRNNYKGASEFRASFEQKVSKPTNAGGLGIPVVLVIVEGGSDAISDAMMSLNHNIPVVVCSGTGRAADILTYAYSHTQNTEKKLIQKHKKKLRDRIIQAYGGKWKGDDVVQNAKKHFTNVMKCMEHRELINIFPMNKHEDLDIAILTALLKSKAAESSDEIRMNQLKLALTWDRADIAQEEIFREDVLWPSDCLNDILMEALLGEKVEFVALILKQNVVLKTFLTTERLQTIYKESLNRADADHLNKLYDDEKKIFSKEFSYDKLKRCMEKLMYKYDHDIEESNATDNGTGEKHSSNPEKLKQFKYPYKQLMIWSILMLRQKMAMFAWQMGSEPVTSAVAASRIYSSMASYVPDNNPALKEKILVFKDEFDNLSRSVLDECYGKHKEKAMMLAERKSPSWSSMTSLQMAASAKNMVYLSSEACQNSLDATWRRGMFSPYQVIWTMYFPIFLLTDFLDVDSMGEKQLTTFQKILMFYTAPITKFFNYSTLYIYFVALFTYFLLVDYQPDKISRIEIICILWVFTYIVDEIYTLLTFPSPTFSGKIQEWLGTLKVIEMLNLLLAVIAFVFHIISKHMNKKTCDVRIIYSINCLIFFIRIMKLYTASRRLGSKLVMIKMMFKELAMFLYVAIVFLMAYGVTRHSLLYGRSEASWKIISDVFFHPYWQLYGELNFDESMKTADTPGSLNSNPTSTSSIPKTECPCWNSSLLTHLTNSSISDYQCPCWYSSVQMNWTNAYRSDIECLCWNSSEHMNLSNTSILNTKCPCWYSSIQMNWTNSSISDSECLCWNASSHQNTTISQTLECQIGYVNTLLVYLLCAGYLVIGTILLVNLLIAVFNHIFTKAEEKSYEIWKFQMYFFTMEFDNKTFLPPPFSIIQHLYFCVKWIARKTCCKKNSQGVQFTERHLEYLKLFEAEETANYLRRTKSEYKDSAQFKLQKRVEELFKLVEEEITDDHGDAQMSSESKFEQLEQAAETMEDKEKIERRETKTDNKYQRELEEEKIYIRDQENDPELDIEAQIHIPESAWTTTPLRHSKNLSSWAIRRKPPQKSHYLHPRLTSQIVYSTDSSDSCDYAKGRHHEPYNTESDVPKRHRKRKSLRRVESYTEDELRSRAINYLRFRNRYQSDSDSDSD